MLWGRSAAELECTGTVCEEPSPQVEKWAHCSKLLRKADALAAQEAHSTLGYLAISRGVPGTKCWLSHESRASGGVSIIAQEAFLQQFKEVKEENVVEAVTGRAAILQLDWPHWLAGLGHPVFAFRSG